MRERLWYNLQNAKFKAGYLCEVSKKASAWGNIYSFVLSFGSASSVAAWTVWDTIPYVWAAIVGLSQALHVAKPYIPFLRYEKEYMELCFKYEFLYLKYEKLWFRYEKGSEDEDCMEQEFYELRDDEVDFLNSLKHVHVPKFSGLTDRISKESQDELKNIFY